MRKILNLCNFFYSLVTTASSIEDSSFSWDFFQTIENPEKMFEYAEKHLAKIDEYGSARGVFVLDTGKSYGLKIALPTNLEAGIHQNQKEIEISQMLPDITAQIISHHPKYYWMIVELARPVKDQKELMLALNLTSPLDIGLLFSKFPIKNHKLTKPPHPIALKVSQLVNDGVLPRDVMKSDSWGYVARDGAKLVLIDYGKLK